MNTKGNFTCIDKVSKKICPPGFKKNLYTQQCEDINECEEIENVCAANEECVNDPGGHTCVIKLSQVPLITHPTSTTPLVTITPVYSEITSSTTPSSTTLVSSTFSTPKPSLVPPTLPQKPPIITNVTRQTPSRQFPSTSPTWHPLFETRNNPPIRCPKGFEYSEESNSCKGNCEFKKKMILLYLYYLDIDECAQNENLCGNLQCDNVPGTFLCFRCKKGFTKDNINDVCVGKQKINIDFLLYINNTFKILMNAKLVITTAVRVVVVITQ